MKTTITSILILFVLNLNAQTADVMYVPNQKSLVATYNSNFSPLGYYIGGYFRTTLPQPYIYTTPASFINRIGVSITNYKVSIMGGAFIESFVDKIELEPDVWVKIYPLRIITNTKRGPDFTLGVNYMKGFRVGVGIAIPFGGIYN
jgi:hypothetical protein